MSPLNDNSSVNLEELFSCNQKGCCRVVVKSGNGSSEIFSVIEEALLCASEYHRQLTELAKEYIQLIIEDGSGGSAEVTPYRVSVDETYITIQLGILKLSRI